MYNTDVDIYIQTSPPLCGLKLGSTDYSRSNAIAELAQGKTSTIPVKN